MTITRRFFLGGVAAAAATVALPSAKAVAAAMPAVPAWVPDGWLPCWGQSVSRTQYAKLFEVIGTTYGERDGETFVLPDLRARCYAAPGPYGSSVAAVFDPGHTHSISTPAEPTHTHSYTQHTHIAPTIALENVIATGDGPAWPAGFVTHFAGKVPLV